MQLTATLTQADLIAALQIWIASPTGGSAGGVTHQMNATVNPVLTATGGAIVELNS